MPLHLGLVCIGAGSGLCASADGRLIFAVVISLVILVCGAGCSEFAERACPMDSQDALILAQPPDPQHCTTREWLEQANEHLSRLLPREAATALTTEDLVTSRGEPVDVFRHFRIRRDGLQSLFFNLRGLKYSAQAASRSYCIEQPAPAWPGFQDVWIPIKTRSGDALSLSGRVGYARDAEGRITPSTCLVILPGLYGDHGVQRSRDLARPLREAGYHVLALELRGHGQTERRYPEMPHAFGAFEADDLMQVADWLQSQPQVRTTGLIGCCWNANIALLAAWYDGSSADDQMIDPVIRQTLVSHDPNRRRFSAGIIALSPVVRGEELMDELDHDRSRWKHPIYAAIQDTVRDRMRKKGYPVTGSLRELMDQEYSAYRVPGAHGLREGYSMLRLVAYKQQPAGDKLESARMPVLIVHGADDPLIPAQDIADLMASVRNPRVAAVVLPSGGHVGFAGYSPRYYLSLIINFFDPIRGAAVGIQPARAVSVPTETSPTEESPRRSCDAQKIQRFQE